MIHWDALRWLEIGCTCKNPQEHVTAERILCWGVGQTLPGRLVDRRNTSYGGVFRQNKIRHQSVTLTFFLFNRILVSSGFFFFFFFDEPGLLWSSPNSHIFAFFRSICSGSSCTTTPKCCSRTTDPPSPSSWGRACQQEDEVGGQPDSWGRVPSQEQGLFGSLGHFSFVCVQTDLLQGCSFISPQGPVAVKVQVPNMQDKSEWKLSGQVLNFTVPLTDQVGNCWLIMLFYSWRKALPMSCGYPQVSVIKVKIHEATGMPAGKQKLQYEVNYSFIWISPLTLQCAWPKYFLPYQGIFIKDSNSLAYYNMNNGAVIHLALKERGGRKKWSMQQWKHLLRNVVAFSCCFGEVTTT